MAVSFTLTEPRYAFIDSGTPDTNVNSIVGGGSGDNRILHSASNRTKAVIVKVQIPARDTLNISNKGYIFKVRLNLDVSTAGDPVFAYPVSSSFTNVIEMDEVTYSTPNREGSSSHVKWDPANPTHIGASATDPICVGGDRFQDFLGVSGTGVDQLDITEREAKQFGFDFGSTVFVILYVNGTSDTTLDMGDSSVVLMIRDKKPDLATLTS